MQLLNISAVNKIVEEGRNRGREREGIGVKKKIEYGIENQWLYRGPKVDRELSRC